MKDIVSFLIFLSGDPWDRRAFGGTLVMVKELVRCFTETGLPVRVFSNSYPQKQFFFNNAKISRIGPSGLYMVLAPLVLLKELVGQRFEDKVVMILIGPLTYSTALILRVLRPFFRRVKVVIFIGHMLTREVWRLDTLYFFPTYVLNRVVMPFVVDGTVVLTPSDYVVSTIKKYKPKAIKKVIHGVRHDVFKPINIQNRSLRIFTWGRHTKDKGFHYLLKAFKEVLKEYAGAELVIAGMGRFSKQLRKLSKDLGISDRVDFLGRIPNKRLVKEINAAEVVVIPSLIEGFGLTALEALACKKPIVASNTRGLNEWLEHLRAAYLVPPGDSNALADAIKHLFSDDCLKRGLATEGYELSKRYRWTAFSRQLLGSLRKQA